MSDDVAVPTTQRDRLRRRALPTRDVHLPRDPVSHAAASEQLAAALVAAQRTGRGPDQPAAQQAVLDARARLDELDADVETFTVRCLPPPEWEALRDEHAPTDEQRRAGRDWNPDTYRPALLATCVVAPAGEPAHTEDDWREYARDGRVSTGEQDLLLATAVALNTRAVQLRAGKGSTPITS